MPEPKKLTLSIIFPLLDAAEDVEGTFRAVAGQTGVDKSSIEIVVLDDGSRDDTLKVVEKHKELFRDFADFRVLKHAKREGLARTRLDGVTAARGKYITFVDKKCRTDADYIQNLLNKNRNIVIGDYYVDKSRSAWGRVLALVRKKIYFPYFNNNFEDINLDFESYHKFKNKGGGSVMLVLRSYYLETAKSQNMGKDVNDDSLFIENLCRKEPLLKTASAKAEYLNRIGFSQNVKHLYNRGPKFVDYYSDPSTRFFPAIVLLVLAILVNVGLAVFVPIWLIYELAVGLVLLIAIATYLSEDAMDFVTCVGLLPIAFFAFCAGILKGLTMKVLRLY